MYNENIKQIFNYKPKNSSNSINLILNWWLSFNEKIIPSKINIISDLPDCLYGESQDNIIKLKILLIIFYLKILFELISIILSQF